MSFPIYDNNWRICSHHDVATKEDFYTKLNGLIKMVPREERIALLGDFNAWVGADYAAWKGCIERQGIDRVNFNVERLLSFCRENQFTITNTLFQQPNIHKTTWMHPRSRHCHLIDYVIVRERDLKDVLLTGAMRGAECQTDHRLVRSTIKRVIIPLRKKRTQQPIKRYFKA